MMLAYFQSFTSYLQTFIMEAINMTRSDYESSYNSPIKYPSVSLLTNPSFNSGSRQTQPRYYTPSHQLFKDYNLYQTKSVRQDQLQNISSLTLQPIITEHDLNEMIQWQKMITFYSDQSQAQKLIIKQKQQMIRRIKQEIGYAEQRVRRQKQKYNYQRKSFSRSKSKRKQHERKKSISEGRIVEEMRMEIQIMKKSLSTKKTKKLDVGCIERGGRKGAEGPRGRRRKNIIYMPINVPNNYGQNIPHYPHGQVEPHMNIAPAQPHIGSPLQFHQVNPVFPGTFNAQQPNYPPPNHMLESQTWNKAPELPLKNNTGCFQAPGPHTNSTFKQLFAQSVEQKVPQKTLDEMLTEQDKILAQNLIPSSRIAPKSKLTPKIEIHKPKNIQNLSPKNLDYFDNGESDIEYHEPPKQSDLLHTSKKSINWVGDQDDMETISLMENTKKATKKTLSPKTQSKNIHAKFVVSHLCDSPSSPEPSKIQIFSPRLQGQASQSNHSHVDISIQSQDKKNKSRSEHSFDRKSHSSSRRKSSIGESNINILIESNSEKPDVSPKNNSKGIQNKILNRNISSILEVDQQAVSTPMLNPSRAIPKIQPMRDSKLRQSRQKGSSLRESEVQKGSLMYTQSGIKTIQPLNKPPSLPSEQMGQSTTSVNGQFMDLQLTPQSVHHHRDFPEIRGTERSQQFDQFENIKLSGDSINFIRSKMKSKQTLEEENDDAILGIKLLNESRHSREKNLRASLEKEGNVPAGAILLAQSEPNRIANKNKLVPQDQDFYEQDDIMPIPTRSHIVKQGSAIQKTKNNRLKVSDIKNSNNASALAKSQGMMELPIEEADQDEELASKIQLPKKRTIE